MLPVFANTAMTMAYMTTKLAGFLESGRHRRRQIVCLHVPAVFTWKVHGGIAVKR